MVSEPTPGIGNPNQPPDLSGLCLAVTGHAPWPMAAVEGARHIVRSVNPAFCRLMDKPMEQLVGKPFYELLPAKDESEKLLDRVFQTGNSETYTEERYPDLHPVFWSYAVWPVWESERPVGLMIQVTETAQLHEKTLAMNEALILGSVHQHELTEAADLSNAQLQEEIGERRNTVRELSEKARLLDLSNDAIIVRDPEGRIVYWNHGAEELYGWSRAEALGKVSHTLLQTEFPKPIEQITEEFHRKDRWTGELVHTKRNGERITVLARKALDRDAQGNPAAVLQTITDISGRKRIEEQLKASVKQTVDLNNEIQGFYHTLSHELKTPLTSAREFVSIVMDGLAGPLNPTQLEYLGIAKESCDQLRLYINDLLDVTRLETGKMSIEFHALPLAPLVERVVEMLAPAAAGKGVSLSSDCQPDLPSVPIDKQRILQVLINLTTNAIKFTPAGGQICLGLSETPAHPECLQVAVRDTGRGIPKDELDMIFERRYQANHNAQSIESQSGLGLGLYICHELVGLHGGRIWVESEVGKGSTFSFVIPKHATTKGAHVLIVDDEQQTRELLRHVLEDQNFEVMTAKGGNEALQLMGRRTPDIVVLDLKMAGMDGPSTLKAIRMKWGLIPVIIYTGYPDGELMQQAMESSPFTLLTKSCPSQQFVETVRRMCPAKETRFPEKHDNASRTLAALPSSHSIAVTDPQASAVLNERITI